MVTVNSVINALKTVQAPGSGEDIHTSGLIRNIAVEGSRVDFDIILGNGQEGLAEQAKHAAEQIEGVKKVEPRILYSSPGQTQQSSTQPSNLKEVKHIIAVSSCKGGVGKSTIAAHLAEEFQRRGLKVGLLDADIHGPSVPQLFGVTAPHMRPDESNRLIPIENNGLKLMSFGFLLGNKPAVMRGPIATRYTQQLLLNTAWGKLDYLIIDMPPGTGDIHLTITQSINLDGAVIVTTPHSLSLTDVARGILMFEKVNVPILGVIENMSYVQAGPGHEKQYVFGDSGADTLKEQFGANVLAEIPILRSFNQTHNRREANDFIQQAADSIDNKLNHTEDLKNTLPQVSASETHITLKWPNGETWSVANRKLRLNSKDAFSVDELTGKSLISEQDIATDIHAKKIIPLGNYALNVIWSDGHSAGIYPYNQIKNLAEHAENK